MSLRRIKWITISAPLIFLFALEAVRAVLMPDLGRLWPSYLLWGGIVVIGTLLFTDLIFGIIGRMQANIQSRNRELVALHDASVGITSSMALQEVLQRVVDEARDLVEARYAALSILDSEGQIVEFLTSGISSNERTRIGTPPRGLGLLGVPIATGQTLIVDDIARDPRGIGFPTNHPGMKSLLAVPMVASGRRLGNLYVTDKLDEVPFDQIDVDVITRFATQSAIAIDNARLLRQVQERAISSERERIAREMHDGPTQVLGYVNTKSQAIEELLKGGQTEQAGEHLQQLSEAAR